MAIVESIHQCANDNAGQTGMGFERFEVKVDKDVDVSIGQLVRGEAVP